VAVEGAEGAADCHALGAEEAEAYPVHRGEAEVQGAREGLPWEAAQGEAGGRAAAPAAPEGARQDREGPVRLHARGTESVSHSYAAARTASSPR